MKDDETPTPDEIIKSLRAENEWLRAKNDWLQTELRSMIHMFDRGLAEQSLPRLVCDKARAALTDEW